MIDNIYKYAAEHKLRFPYKGSITTEDLFDLTPENLDVVFKALNKRVSVAGEASLLTSETMTPEQEALEVSLRIVRDVFAQKQAEIEARKKAAARKIERQRIAGIITQKENEALQNLSIDELKAMLNDE